jgi:hypothetical protein
LARYGTRAQARFALKDRGQSLDFVDQNHRKIEDAIASVVRGVPSAWRRVRLTRSQLDRFVFEPSDIVLAVGQDGLVANVAKYLTGQPVIGFNPDRGLYEGVLVRNDPADTTKIIEALMSGAISIEERTMVQVTLDDRQMLLALNEIFIGHRSHQSARYRIRVEQQEERQSSSGVIVSTGTGSTGWARSINSQRRSSLALPAAADAVLSLFVREAFPGTGFQATLTEAALHAKDTALITSEMDDSGVIFGDGIEDDSIAFTWGASATISVAAHRLRLVVSASTAILERAA